MSLDDAFPSLSVAVAVGKKKIKNTALQTAEFVPAGRKTPSHSAPVPSPVSPPPPSVDFLTVFESRVDVSHQKAMSVANQRAVNDNGTVRLPVDDYEAEICEKAAQNDVLIIAGDTGSGKSTRAPTFLAKTAHHKPGMKIFVTQPRRVAAISLAKRVGSELGDVASNGAALFQRVGYAVGQDRHFDDKAAEFVFCTCGWLLLKLLNDLEFSNGVSFLVIDEAHERDADMELLIMVCAKIILKRFARRIKIVLMSATLNYRAFQHYFPGTIGLVNINMRRFPVQICHLNTLVNAPQFFPSETAANALNEVINNAVEEKDKQDPKGHFAGFGQLCRIIYEKLAPGTANTVLVFVSGLQEIDIAYDIVAETLGKNAEIYIMHSSIEQETLMQVFVPLPLPTNSKDKSIRFVISTNIAESSVTIPNVSIVIDFGKQKTMQRMQSSNMMELRAVDISRAAADQRAGRTGRVCNGTVFRFYSDIDYRYFPDHNRSEIQDAPPATTILRFFSLKQSSGSKLPELDDPLKCIAQLVDPPDQFAVLQAFRDLVTLGALSAGESNKSSITPFGNMLIRLPLSFEHSEFVLFGCQFGEFSVQFAVIGAYLNNHDLWLNPSHKDADFMRYHRWLRSTTASRQRFGIHNSDLLAAVEVFRTMLSFDRRRGSQAFNRWIDENGFHYDRVSQFMSTACDMISRLGECGFEACKIASTALFSRRHKSSAMTMAQIDSLLPMSPRNANACALIIGWALSKNVVQATTSIDKRPTLESMQKERTKFLASLTDDDANGEKKIKRFDEQCADRVLSDFLRNETISMRVVLQVTGFIGNQTPDLLLRRIICSSIGPLDETKTESSMDKFDQHGGRASSRGTIRFCPQNISVALHILQQLLNRGTGTIRQTFAKLQCEISLQSVDAPDMLSWTRGSSRVYDFPPRSPLHCFASARKPVVGRTKKCFMASSSTYLAAVASDFTLTGRSLRVHTLSLIPIEYRLVFEVVASFANNSKFSVEKYTDYLTEQERFRIRCDSFASALLKTDEDRLQAEQIIGPLSDPLVSMLKKWTLEDITDGKRSFRICSLLHTLMNAVACNN